MQPERSGRGAAGRRAPSCAAQVRAGNRSSGYRVRHGPAEHLRPVLQAADILCVKGQVVPVGKDNAAHVEVTREIARRFNHLYGEDFPVSEMIMSETPTLVGTDGQGKMSQNKGNAIALSDDPATVRRKVMATYTDPNRVQADVPGTVEGNPVFAYHDVFNPDRAQVELVVG